MGNLGDLKAQQLILLAVFVSFVTSVATGITTVSLIEAAPQPVQQVVNRVVERTVERVVPEEKPSGDAPTQKEVVTVVVKDEDLAIGAAEAAGKSVARIYDRDGAFVALGLAVAARRVVTDAAAVNMDSRYEVDVAGTRVPAMVDHEGQGFALIVLPDDAPALTPATIGAASTLRLAQSLIAVTGQTSTAIATGSLVGLQRGQAEGAPIVGIEAALAGAAVLPGSPLANSHGEVVGIRVEDGSAPGVFSTAEAAAAFAAPAPAAAPAVAPAA